MMHTGLIYLLSLLLQISDKDKILQEAYLSTWRLRQKIWVEVPIQKRKRLLLLDLEDLDKTLIARMR